MTRPPFKVIVVGGGPVGLTAAHALNRAGIDFLVLERRESTVMDLGSHLILTTIGQRALGQLGLLKTLRTVTSELRDVSRFDHHGSDLGSVSWFRDLNDNFGCFPEIISRYDLSRILFETLPSDAQSKILSSKKVSTVETTTDGVTVCCEDGTSYDATLVIGADGTHSAVRASMRRLALAAGSDKVNEEKPFLTTFTCLWIRFPTSAATNVPRHVMSESHGPTASTQMFVGEELSMGGLYIKCEKPSRERVRHSEADIEEQIKKWGHLPLTPSKVFTVADAYANRQACGLVSLDEGVLDHWSWSSRIVLAGDAAHKFTPTTGQGVNNGIIDVVALVNELHKIAQPTEKNAAGAAPSEGKIEAAFEAYQASRHKIVSGTCKEAGGATMSATWSTWIHKVVDRYVLGSNMMQKMMIGKSSQRIAQTPAFNFVEGEEPLMGKVAWAHPVPPKGQVAQAA